MSVQEIQAEREAQRAKWGDDDWTAAEWSALIAHYATRRAVGDLRTVDVMAFRADMVKVAALALAAIESIDRKGK